MSSPAGHELFEPEWTEPAVSEPVFAALLTETRERLGDSSWSPGVSTGANMGQPHTER